METRAGHIAAVGPEGLAKILGEFLDKSKTDSAFASQEHYILYQMGEQKSLIKVDTSQPLFHFWHYDLMGRPATFAVKETIAHFLWEKCGEKAKYQDEDKWLREVFPKFFHDISKVIRFQQQSLTGFFSGGKMAIDDEEHGFEHAKQSLAIASVGQHGLFAGTKRKAVDAALEVDPDINKKQKI